MSTILTTHRVSSLNLFIAIAILIVAALAFAVLSDITSPNSAVVPITRNPNAYVDFLRGEKVMFTSPAGLASALANYRAGEQTLYDNLIISSSVLETYRAGEKSIVLNVESALVEYRQGEKNIK